MKAQDRHSVTIGSTSREWDEEMYKDRLLIQDNLQLFHFDTLVLLQDYKLPISDHWGVLCLFCYIMGKYLRYYRSWKEVERVRVRFRRDCLCWKHRHCILLQ